MRMLILFVSTAMVALTGAAGVAGTAFAQPQPVPSGQNTVDVVGINPDTGEQVFTGTFTARSAKEDRSARTGISLVGDLTGQLTAQPGQPQGQGRGPQDVTRQNLAMPVNAISASGAPAGESQAACGILDLTLGPLDLNLLGLRVQLSQVDLVITAIPGGGLLGDLLCAVANLLNPDGTLSDLLRVLDLLNQILGILGGV
jgi:hypothetical protein